MNVSVAIDEGVAPEFVEPLKPKIVKPENPATLKAVVTGKPVPVVTWYQNDQIIAPNDQYNIEFNPSTGESYLTISEVTESHEDVYTVEAVNSFGRAKCRANILIGIYFKSAYFNTQSYQ